MQDLYHQPFSPITPSSLFFLMSKKIELSGTGSIFWGPEELQLLLKIPLTAML